MSRHHIDYESLAQDAMRGLVRTVMQRIAKSGLPGDHHFYISFHTRGAGVSLSKRLLERYPDEMTIVLQNKFSDLKAYDERFEVTLWFDSIAERLTVPYPAIKVFFDPSVPFGHQFEVSHAAPAAHGPVLIDREGAGKAPPDRRLDEQRPSTVTSVTTSAGPRSRPSTSAAAAGNGGSKDQAKNDPKSVAKHPTANPAPKLSVPASSPNQAKVPAIAATRDAGEKSSGDKSAKPADAADKHNKPAETSADRADPASQPSAAKVVALDAFRKKS